MRWLIVTEHSYDGAGNLLSTTRGVGPARRAHECASNTTPTTGRPRRSTARASAPSTSTTALGNRTEVTVAPGRPEQRVNRFRYDLDNRLDRRSRRQRRRDAVPLRRRRQQARDDPARRGVRQRRQPGQYLSGLSRSPARIAHTTFTYDLDNRLTRVVDPLGGETLYEYDALGNQTKITDANGGVTENTFDAAGRLLTNLVRGAERGGVLVANDYDAFGNVVRTRRSFADGSDTRQIAYGYDKLDRQTTITGFDRVEQLTPTTVFREAFSTVIDYDAFGNQTKLAYGLYLPQPADAGYDAAKAALAHPLVATFNYDALDRLESTTDGVKQHDRLRERHPRQPHEPDHGLGHADARTVTLRLRPGRSPGAPRDAAGGIVTLDIRRGRQPDAEAHAAKRHREHAERGVDGRRRSPMTATAA